MVWIASHDNPGALFGWQLFYLAGNNSPISHFSRLSLTPTSSSSPVRQANPLGTAPFAQVASGLHAHSQPASAEEAQPCCGTSCLSAWC